MICMCNMQNMQNMQTWTPVVYSSSTETMAHAWFSNFIPASVLVSIVNSRSYLQNQILSIRSWKAPSEIPGGRMNTQSWRLVSCNFFGVIGQQEMRICPGCFIYAQSGGLNTGYCAPTWCWISADAVCPTVPCSVNQIINMQNMSNMQNEQEYAEYI